MELASGQRRPARSRLTGMAADASVFSIALAAQMLRIPTKPAMHSNLKPAGYSDLKPATLGVIRMGLRDDVSRFGGGQAAG